MTLLEVQYISKRQADRIITSNFIGAAGKGNRYIRIGHRFLQFVLLVKQPHLSLAQQKGLFLFGRLTMERMERAVEKNDNNNDVFVHGKKP